MFARLLALLLLGLPLSAQEEPDEGDRLDLPAMVPS